MQAAPCYGVGSTETLLPHVHMREGVKQSVLSVCQFVCQFVQWKILKSEYRQNSTISKTDSSIAIVKEPSYVYLTVSKAVLYPLLFQQFPI